MPWEWASSEQGERNETLLVYQSNTDREGHEQKKKKSVAEERCRSLLDYPSSFSFHRGFTGRS
jgi:hypothetical protein